MSGGQPEVAARRLGATEAVELSRRTHQGDFGESAQSQTRQPARKSTPNGDKAELAHLESMNRAMGALIRALYPSHPDGFQVAQYAPEPPAVRQPGPSLARPDDRVDEAIYSQRHGPLGPALEAEVALAVPSPFERRFADHWVTYEDVHGATALGERELQRLREQVADSREPSVVSSDESEQASPRLRRYSSPAVPGDAIELPPRRQSVVEPASAAAAVAPRSAQQDLEQLQDFMST
jgi:hypothetical protein